MRSTLSALALPALAASALLVALAGCAVTDDPLAALGSAAPVADDAACTPAAAGEVSDSIGVAGEPGSTPTLTFASPVAASLVSTERTVVSGGEGAQLVDGSIATVDFSLYNGSTGLLATSTGHGEGTGVSLTIDRTKLLTGMYLTLACSRVGDRVVGAIPPVDAYGDQGYPDLGIAPATPIVFVADVVGIMPDRAEGVSQPAPPGLPAVELADDGAPTVTIPATAPPAELQVGVLRLGDGPVVADGDEVTVQYQGVNWTTGAVFDESWGSGPRSFLTGGVIAGFGSAMVGQAVGSQVIAVIPPDLGYGPAGGNANAGIAADDTLVFVIDILRTSSAVG